MSEKEPTRTDWFRLYQAAIQVKELAPWQWMQEDDIFGVQNPEHDEIGFVSVMGMLGEYYSIAVYQGTRGLAGFYSLQELGPQTTYEELFNIPHFQASFEDRDQLTKQDRDVIKDLGLKFRGRQAWPLFRSYRPGFAPWYLDAGEVRFVSTVLEQVLDIAPRLHDNPGLLTPEHDDDFLIRVPYKSNGTIEWQDEIRAIPPPPLETIPLAMNLNALAQVQQLPLHAVTLEIDLFMLPAQIGRRGERPRFGYVLLVMDSNSGMIMATQMLEANPTLIDMYGMVPVTLVHELVRLQLHPATIYVQTPILYQLLIPLAKELDTNLQLVTHLPQVEAARAMLLQQF